MFGITGVQALGLAATLRSVGIRSEEGGSSIARGLGAINKAIIGGGEKLVALSKLTGIASKDMKKAFGADAIGVLTKFSLGLDKFIATGGDATQALSFFGLEGIRDLRTLGSLAKNTDLLTQKLAQSARAFKENTALEKEFAIQSTSLANKFTILLSRFQKVGKQLTTIFGPGIQVTIDLISDLTTKLSTLLQATISLRAGEKARSRIQADIFEMETQLAVREIQSNIKLEGNININAPAGVVKSVDAKVSGASAGNLGLNMAGAG